MRPNNFESAALDIFKSGIKNSDDLSCAKRKTSKKEKIKMSSNRELYFEVQHFIMVENHKYEVLTLYKEQQDRTLDPIEERLFLQRHRRCS